MIPTDNRQQTTDNRQQTTDKGIKNLNKELGIKRKRIDKS